jgi:hypothetical protein
MGHMATLESSRTGRQVWNRGTRGNTRALPRQEAGPVSWGTWRRGGPPVQDVGFGTVGVDLSLVRRGTRFIGYRHGPTQKTEMDQNEIPIQPKNGRQI